MTRGFPDTPIGCLVDGGILSVPFIFMFANGENVVFTGAFRGPSSWGREKVQLCYCSAQVHLQLVPAEQEQDQAAAREALTQAKHLNGHQKTQQYSIFKNYN